MKFSSILGVTLLLTVTATSIVQARSTSRSEHTCGNLGPGTNVCNKCGELVVKAAKVQKQLVYTSPEVINAAAAARKQAGSFSVGTGSAAYNANSGYSPYNGVVSTSSSLSSSSSAGILGKLVSGNSSPFYPVSSVSSGSGCGCGKKPEPLEARDLLLSPDPNKQIVPSFPPIGDLCYPSNNNNAQTVSKLQINTKVRPAYPSKVTCNPPPAPEQVCVNIVNGQIDQSGLKNLGLTTAYNGASATSGQLFGKLSGSAFDSASSFGKYTSSAGSLGGYGSSSSSYGNSGSFGGYGSLSNGYSSSSSLGGYGSSSGGYSSSSSLGGYGSSSGGYSSLSSLGGYGSSSSGSSSFDSFGGYGSSTSSGYSSSSVGEYNPYGSGSAGASAGKLNQQINSYGTLSEFNQESGSYDESGCDDSEPKVYSYPQLPADPVSLTLAYKNLFPRILGPKTKSFVPEDKLAFGHRTIPTEKIASKKRLNVPEEKLQILDKPVVELKPLPSAAPVTVGSYDEQEEAKLAELEAIEYERIKEEELSKQKTNVITYGDLGYAPINTAQEGKWSKVVSANSNTNAFNTNSGLEPAEESGCGPVGPPAPDYVPGSVVINQNENNGEAEDGIQTNIEKVYFRHYEDEHSDEEDDSEGSSGIFARLRSSAQKYGSPCGAA